ncbi:MAG: ATP-binding cassette domain-containing protein [Bacilli bacterium]|nr:ATP-binding cassette domain-containing protein [Bacilli bacterium]
MNYIELSIKRKSFGETVLFSDTHFSISAGATVAVTGHSGAGKTTLLKMASGIDTKWDGEFLLSGTEMDKKKAFGTLKKTSSFVFQNIDVIDCMTVNENITLPFAFNKQKVDEQKLVDLLKKLGLFDKKNCLAKNLSLGEKQRVAIARAFIVEPQIIFADEPTGSLDDDSTKNVMDLLISLSKEKGTSLLMVTHRKSLLPLFDNVYEIKNGKIQEASR